VKHVLILAVGRLRDAGYRRACADYYRRCSGRLRIEERELRDLEALRRALAERSGPIVLDERGEQVTSREFARLLDSFLAGPSPELVFVIGGPDGLDDDLRRRAGRLLGLGRMTIAHGLVRVILAEQLYRAVSILDRAPYHRD